MSDEYIFFGTFDNFKLFSNLIETAKNVKEKGMIILNKEGFFIQETDAECLSIIRISIPVKDFSKFFLSGTEKKIFVSFKDLSIISKSKAKKIDLSIRKDAPDTFKISTDTRQEFEFHLLNEDSSEDGHVIQDPEFSVIKEISIQVYKRYSNLFKKVGDTVSFTINDSFLQLSSKNSSQNAKENMETDTKKEVSFTNSYPCKKLFILKDLSKNVMICLSENFPIKLVSGYATLYVAPRINEDPASRE